MINNLHLDINELTGIKLACDVKARGLAGIGQRDLLCRYVPDVSDAVSERPLQHGIQEINQDALPLLPSENELAERVIHRIELVCAYLMLNLASLLAIFSHLAILPSYL